MAHLFAPQPSDPELPVFFNVDGVVGAAPAQNRREDVLLVQFAFHLIGSSTLATTPPEVHSAAKAVRMTGSIDDATITAIKAMQKTRQQHSPGTVVDGRVSPAKGGYAYGKGIWTIAHLNNSMQERHVGIWPRLDKIPGCPDELQRMVTRTVAGT